ncbi:ECF-type sigma factor [Wenzhouxiangella marina]|uniref:ECF sigma factor family protein n=1 Tax=Wenzhouxiangella marina TaxID=1579979 RepID=A0A0K0XUH1_9GAMM|nr:ECF-type sigma factor [Wenzhouxiangella marina]AKS41333.1 ECF sigma factor family protein [Wenzhouxiangella marina]MBB6086917.1 RNA polymerase sigma factor (TIGR02999 family) [Wenzhouxiangella marina]
MTDKASGSERSSNDPRRDEERFHSIYSELRSAARRARRGGPGQTLNTTALVHEAWLKLRQSDRQYADEEHYVSTAAVAMRQVLVDHARYRAAACRDREQEVPILTNDLDEFAARSSVELLALDEALNDLADFDARGADLVVLRFFGGVSLERAAEILKTSRRTAARDWARARAFLAARLQH